MRIFKCDYCSDYEPCYIIDLENSLRQLEFYYCIYELRGKKINWVELNNIEVIKAVGNINIEILNKEY